MAKLIVGAVMLLSFAYVLFFVPLGQKTLYQHLRNISGTNEAQELRDGIKAKAESVTTDVVDAVPEFKEVDDKVNAVKRAVGSDSNTKEKKPVSSESDATPAAAPHSLTVSSDDRAALDRLLKSKLK